MSPAATAPLTLRSTIWGVSPHRFQLNLAVQRCECKRNLGTRIAMRGRTAQRAAVAGLIMPNMWQRLREQRHMLANGGTCERVRLAHERGRCNLAAPRFDAI